MSETVDVPSTTIRDPKWVLLVGGLLGALCAAILIVEKVHYLDALSKGEKPDLICGINAFVDCGGVINTWQASVFGFPNPLIGVVGFSIVVTLAVLLFAGVRLPEWVWAGLQAGTVFAIGFLSWLQFQSIYEIGKLCPWCMVVWAVTIPIFVTVAARNLRTWHPGTALARLFDDWSLLIVLLWYVAIAAAIWFKFGENLWRS